MPADTWIKKGDPSYDELIAQLKGKDCPMRTTSAQRQAKFRDDQRRKGLVAVTVWVHEHQAPQLQIAAAMLKDSDLLAVGSLTNTATGRFVRLR